MKPKGYLLPLIGLAAGIVLGLGMIYLESTLRSELVSLLRDEARASCECDIRVDGSIDISFLTLTATATRLHLVERGETRLYIDKIHALFDLSGIFDRKILLTDLQLYGADARGVSPESATYRFIDHLTAPLPPERDRPDRWRLTLTGLHLIDSRFHEDLPRSKLRLQGTGASIALSRTPDDDFLLLPKLDKLAIVAMPVAGAPNIGEIVLGHASSRVTLRELETLFQETSLIKRAGFIRADARSFNEEGNRLEGTLAYHLDSGLLGLPPWLKFQLQGQGALLGSLGNPGVQGEFSLRPETSLSAGFEGGPNIELDRTRGTFDFDFNRGSPKARISELSGSTEDRALSLARPFTLEDDYVDGTFRFRAGRLEHNGIELRGVDTSIRISGSIPDILIEIESKADMLLVSGTPVLKDPKFRMHDEGSRWALEVVSSSPTHGTVRGTGYLAEDRPGDWRLHEVSFEAKNYWPPKSSGLDSDPPPAVTVSAEGRFEGPIVGLGFGGSGSARLHGVPLEGAWELRRGVFTWSGANQAQSLDAALTVDTDAARPSRLSVNARSLLLSELNPGVRCSNVSGGLRYDFNLGQTFEGRGALDLSKVEIGCEPVVIRLSEPRTLPVERGAIQFAGVPFEGGSSKMRVDGMLAFRNEIDLGVKGSLDLRTLAHFAPAFDDLRGLVTAEVRATGSLPAPLLAGTGLLENVGFSSAAQNISGDKIQAALVLDEREIRIRDVRGRINGGALAGSGTIPLDDYSASSMDISFEDLLLEPRPELSLLASGDMKLIAAEPPQITGTIRISSGEFSRNIELPEILRLVTQNIFGTARTWQASSEARPEILLDIAVQAPRNLAINTNFLGAEAKADLRITGTTREPRLQGGLEVLSGWFGLRNRRFEITSGRIFFTPDSAEPQLAVIGESTLRASDDNVLVIIDITGPLTNPKVRLASDRGLSEKEVLTMITQGTSVNQLSRSTGFEGTFGMQEFALVRRDSPFDFRNFLRSLTTIDGLSIEPRFNSLSGEIEPALVARKNITRNAYLLGESFFGAAVRQDRLSGVYDLTRDLAASGYVESISTKQNLIVGFDLSYAVLRSQEDFLKFEFTGVHAVSLDALTIASRLSPTTRLPVDEIPALVEEIQRFYGDYGFFEVEIDGRCVETSGYCRNLAIDVREGRPSILEGIVFDGQPVRPLLPVTRLPRVRRGEPATRQTLETARQTLLGALRSEGYISARVHGKYVVQRGSKQRLALVLEVDAGKPVSFEFDGNTVFSAEDFLNSIDLLNRQQPFGGNTINILLENIERMYRERGYLLVLMRDTKTEDAETGRVYYRILIVEGPSLSAGSVKIDGLARFSREELYKRIDSRERGRVERILSPTYAITEEIEDNATFIRSVLVESGLPDAIVRYELRPDLKSESVDIVYTILEGREFGIGKVEFEGLPAGVKLPALENGGLLSTEKVNQRIFEVLSNVRNEGYLAPSFETALAPDFSVLTVRVAPGALTTVDTIEFEGNLTTKDKVLARNVLLEAGGAWSEKRIDESRRRLLKLGLFSRVEIVPADGELTAGSERLLVRVVERPLRTLSIGAGASSEFGHHLFTEASDRSFFRDGRSLTFRLDGFYDFDLGNVTQGLALLRYADPYVFDTEYSLAEDLRFQRLETSTQEFDLSRVSLASYVYRTWKTGESWSFGHTLSQESLDNVSSDAVLSDLDMGTLNLSYLSTRLDLDYRDSPLNPRSGYDLNFEYLLATPAIGSEAHFQSLLGRASWLGQPIGSLPRWSLAGSVRGGVAVPFGGTEDIPITQRFYLGGRTTVRGFRENSLGPRGELGSVIGGDLLTSGSMELRYLFADSAEVHTFLDAGTVFLRERSTSISDIRESTGIGVRYLSPLGPVGFDLGHPIDERAGEPSIRFHFSIGSNF